VVKTLKLETKYSQAPLFKRFCSYLVDIILVNLVISLPFYKYLRSFNDVSTIINGNEKGLSFIAFLIALSLLLYFTILEWKIGTTLGKAIFGLNVISLRKKELNFIQTLISNLTIPFSIVLLVDVLYMFFKNSRQRLFETFSGVLVVEKGVVLK